MVGSCRARWLLLVPALLLVGAVLIVPSAAGLARSFTAPGDGGQAVFVGSVNYWRVLADRDARTSVGNGVEYALISAPLSMIAGLALAIAIHFSPTLRRAIYPLLIASQAVPIPIIAPLLVLWLGFGIEPKLVVIALVSFFPIVVTTLAGLAAVDRELIKLMRTFDATRGRTFWHVELPSALPGVLTGAKIAAAIAVIAAVFAELSGANAGLGYLYQQSEAQLLMPRAYATVAILSAFAIALFALLTLAERRALPWAHETTGETR